MPLYVTLMKYRGLSSNGAENLVMAKRHHTHSLLSGSTAKIRLTNIAIAGLE